MVIIKPMGKVTTDAKDYADVNANFLYYYFSITTISLMGQDDLMQAKQLCVKRD